MIPPANAIVNSLLVRENVDDPERYIAWLKKQASTSTLRDSSFGAAISTSGDEMVELNARELDIDLNNPATNRAALERDLAIIEANGLAILRRMGLRLSDEGHGVDGDRVASAWINVDNDAKARDLVSTVLSFARDQRNEPARTSSGTLNNLMPEADQLIWQNVSELGQRLIDVDIYFFDTEKIAEWASMAHVDESLPPCRDCRGSTEAEAIAWAEQECASPLIVCEAADPDDPETYLKNFQALQFVVNWTGQDGVQHHTFPLRSMKQALDFASTSNRFNRDGELYIDEYDPNDQYRCFRHHLDCNYEVVRTEPLGRERFGEAMDPENQITPSSLKPYIGNVGEALADAIKEASKQVGIQEDAELPAEDEPEQFIQAHPDIIPDVYIITAVKTTDANGPANRPAMLGNVARHSPVGGWYPAEGRYLKDASVFTFDEGHAFITDKLMTDEWTRTHYHDFKLRPANLLQSDLLQSDLGEAQELPPEDDPEKVIKHTNQQTTVKWWRSFEDDQEIAEENYPGIPLDQALLRQFENELRASKLTNFKVLGIELGQVGYTLRVVFEGYPSDTELYWKLVKAGEEVGMSGEWQIEQYRHDDSVQPPVDEALDLPPEDEPTGHTVDQTFNVDDILRGYEHVPVNNCWIKAIRFPHALRLDMEIVVRRRGHATEDNADTLYDIDILKSTDDKTGFVHLTTGYSIPLIKLREAVRIAELSANQGHYGTFEERYGLTRNRHNESADLPVPPPEDDPGDVLRAHEQGLFGPELKRLGFRQGSDKEEVDLFDEKVPRHWVKLYKAPDNKRHVVYLYLVHCLSGGAPDIKFNIFDEDNKRWWPQDKGEIQLHPQTTAQAAACLRDVDAAMERCAAVSVPPDQEWEAVQRVTRHYSRWYWNALYPPDRPILNINPEV